MSNSKYNWGYCRTCMKNVPHFRGFTSPFLRTLDRLSLQVLKLFRIGPWYCSHCESGSFLLSRENPNAAQANAANLLPDYQPEEDDNQPRSEPIGNFIRQEQSLLMRSMRLKRFSEKYRDGVVRKLMSGKLTISQVRKEQEITEHELIDWIADLVERLESKIQATEPLQATARLQFDDSASLPSDDIHTVGFDLSQIPDGQTVEGQVRPR